MTRPQSALLVKIVEDLESRAAAATGVERDRLLKAAAWYRRGGR